MLWAWLISGVHPADLEHPSGEFSARLMIIAMMLTPLRMIFPRVRWLAWLRRQRRALGVAAFGYAVLHTVFYLLDMETLRNVLAELPAVGIWTGWLALLLFVPLAITSNAASVRALGNAWQQLHRLTYPAAVLVLLHWITVHNNAVAAWIHFLPLLLLETWRVAITIRKKST